MTGVVAAVMAFGISLVGGWVVYPLLLQWNVIDRPNERSSHTRATARGGGIAVIGAVCLAGMVIGVSADSLITWGIVGLTIVLSAVSMVDDLRSLSARLRLVCHLAVALAGLGLVGLGGLYLGISGGTGWNVPPLVAWLLGVLWVAGYTNAFNFMDGINGIAAGQAFVTGLGMALITALAGASWTSAPVLLSLAVAGAAAGFAPHNFPRARMFMGDVGSAPLGFLLAVLVFWSAHEQGWWLLIPLSLLHANYVLDTGITLARRAWRRERLGAAHREHAYQRLVRAGKSHSFVTLSEVGLQAVALSLMMAYVSADPSVRPLLACLTLAIWVSYLAYAEIVFRRSNAQEQNVGAPPGATTANGTSSPRAHLAVNTTAAFRTTSRIMSYAVAQRRVVLVLLYTSTLSLSFWLAYELRFDFETPPARELERWRTLCWLIPLKLASLLLFRQFQGLLSYFSVPDLRRIFYALAIPSLVECALWYGTEGQLAPSRGIILVDFVFSCLSIAGTRLGFRLLRERSQATNGLPQRARRVAIIGAGDAGANLARELLAKRGLGLYPILFLDDDKNKWGSRLYNLPVEGPPERLLEGKTRSRVEQVIIAMPSAPVKRIGQIVKLLQAARLKFETVPSLDQLATGKIKVSQLRSVEIQDLLHREPVVLEHENIRKLLQGRVVMVTGAGGSIGGELCRQIAMFSPAQLLLVEQSEVQMFQTEQELIGLGHRGIILPLVADICDTARMTFIFDRFRPHVLFHAAAHKHVPMMESQPSEAIRNNTLGTVQLAELSAQYGVGRFVLVSTDKAINPTSVMGATKRLAESFVQSLYAAEPHGTKFMAVRFGNVLGSSGSVIPLFKKQIAAGGPVRVTHPEVTRYFMTIPEAVGLVLQSCAQGTGGEIFILDMGEPVKIVDLAHQLIELSGLKPGEDIEIEFTGLRPGEKLFEELSHTRENTTPTAHKKIMRLRAEAAPLDEMRQHLHHIESNLYSVSPDDLKVLLTTAVPEYDPYLSGEDAIPGRSTPSPAVHPDGRNLPARSSRNGRLQGGRRIRVDRPAGRPAGDGLVHPQQHGRDGRLPRAGDAAAAGGGDAVPGPASP
jgi:FlaA1/EpsC-like NDP-sugar epimerase/UDP-N-acetylmuramyl pentapeptide phosphotransferase/UDP-N-acetylglucosamine-1-phosphate transferase